MTKVKTKKPTLNYQIYELSVLSSAALCTATAFMIYSFFIAPPLLQVVNPCGHHYIDVSARGVAADCGVQKNYVDDARNRAMLPYRALTIAIGVISIMNVAIASKSLKLHYQRER